MAVDIGRALSGLGAAFKNEMPAFIQQTRQEDELARVKSLQDEDLAERRRKTMFQDAAAAKIMFDAGDYRGIADLMEDRVNLLRNTDADTSHTRNFGALAVRAAAGDPQAITELGGGLGTTMAVAYATGMVPMPVDRTTTVKKGDVVYNQDGTVLYDNRVPEEPKQGKDERGVLRFETGPNAGQPVYGSGAATSAVPASGVSPSSIPAVIRRPGLQSVEDRAKYANLSPFDQERLMREDALAAQADEDRLTGIARDRRADDAITAALVIPDVLIAGLDEDVAARASAAYAAGNGGSSGMTAASKVIEDAKEAGRFTNIQTTLPNIFPSASGQELAQLQYIVEGAESFEKGMELAQTRREGQKMDAGGRANKKRGLVLIDRILANGELNAVLGPRQGRHEVGDLAHRNDTLETNAIVDINNLRDILTGDNLGMMSGVLSESDMLIIANIAGGGLDRNRSEEVFRADIADIREIFARAFDGNAAPVVTSSSASPIQSTGSISDVQGRANEILNREKQ